MNYKEILRFSFWLIFNLGVEKLFEREREREKKKKKKKKKKKEEERMKVFRVH